MNDSFAPCVCAARSVLGKNLQAQVIFLPQGVQVLVTGGDLPHIGAVSIADTNGNISTVCFPGHRDDVVSSAWAAAFGKAGIRPAVVCAGIHYDGLRKEEIPLVLQAAGEMLTEVLEQRKGACHMAQTEHTALLFDLDGVLVDTAKYHYIAWKALADELGIPFTKQDNERLKGVSRMRSLEILLELGHRTMTDAEKRACCEKKNALYVSFIEKMTADELLPGVREFLQDARENGYKIALGSASKNSMLILQCLELVPMFDAIVDGTKVTKAKPDPEVFLQGAKMLGVEPAACIVFEDAVAGIQAACAAGMTPVGIGSPAVLTDAAICIPGFKETCIAEIKQMLKCTK